jgi:hypothetical protein
MSKMNELYTACMLHGINPQLEEPIDLENLYFLYDYFRNPVHAVEAYEQGYTAEDLKAKGNYPPYWVYLIWVKQ